MPSAIVGPLLNILFGQLVDQVLITCGESAIRKQRAAIPARMGGVIVVVSANASVRGADKGV